ncbi:MAG: glutathione S-transferase family protein [Myxococcota bacterium]
MTKSSRLPTRLLTIPISHYCERARWALDHAGVHYDERAHLQVFHYAPVRRHGGAHTVPVLVADGAVYPDSSEIVAFADRCAPRNRKLYPSGPANRRGVEDLERRHLDVLGVEARRIMYYHFFRWGRAALSFNRGTAPFWEHALLWLGFPFAARFAKKRLSVSRPTMLRGRSIVDDEFDRVGERLSDGRRYLMGDDFTAADLTFACMAAAVLAPERYGTRLPTIDEVPDETRDAILHYRAHPAGRFGLRLFAQERPATAAAAGRPTGQPNAGS